MTVMNYEDVVDTKLLQARGFVWEVICFFGNCAEDFEIAGQAQPL